MIGQQLPQTNKKYSSVLQYSICHFLPLFYRSKHYSNHSDSPSRIQPEFGPTALASFTWAHLRNFFAKPTRAVSLRAKRRKYPPPSQRFRSSRLFRSPPLLPSPVPPNQMIAPQIGQGRRADRIRMARI